MTIKQLSQVIEELASPFIIVYHAVSHNLQYYLTIDSWSALELGMV